MMNVQSSYQLAHPVWLPSSTAVRCSLLKRNLAQTIGFPGSSPKRTHRTVSVKAGTATMPKPVKAAAMSSVQVHISTHFQAAFGEELKVVGSLPVLGSWDLNSAPSMQWNDGHIWEADFEVPEGTEFEYKLVHVGFGANWEPSENRYLKAALEDKPAKKVLGSIELSCPWASLEGTETVFKVSDAGSFTTQEFEGLVIGQDPQGPLAKPSSSSDWTLNDSGLPEDITEALQGVQPSDKTVAQFEKTKAVDEVSPKSKAKPKAAALEFKGELPEGLMQDVFEAADSVQDQIDLSPEAAYAPPPKQEASRNGTVSLLQGVGVTLAAAAFMSALAIDVTDVAIVTGLAAVGSTLLPGGNKGADNPMRVAGQAVNATLGVAEGMARAAGLKSFSERRQEKEAGTEAVPAVEEGYEGDDEGSQDYDEADAAEVSEQKSPSTPSSEKASFSGVVLAATFLSALDAFKSSKKAPQDASEEGN